MDPDQQSSDVLSNLPAEVWVCILQSIEFSRTDILSIVYTCDTFRRIAQPFLFKTVAFRPPTTLRTGKSGDVGLHQEAYLDRLYFISSCPVACHVSEVHIRWKRPLHPGMGLSWQSLNILLGNLPRFTGITSLCLDNITLTVVSLNVIIHFRHLLHLTLLSCEFHIHDGSELRPIKTRLMTLKIIIPSRARRSGSTWWLPFVCPDVTESLSLSGPDMTRMFLDSLIGGPLFHKLKVLGLHHRFLRQPDVDKALSCCPSVETLLFWPEFSTAMEDPTAVPLPSGVFPRLTRVAADFSTLIPTLRGRNVQEVGLLTTLRGDEELDIATLQISVVSPWIRSLRLQVTEVTAGTILGIPWCFTSLKECTVIITGLRDNFITKVNIPPL